MGILDKMTKEQQKVYRQVKLKEVQEYNKDLINDLGIAKSDFNMKKAFTRDGVVVIGMFDNEFRKEKGFFFELINSDLEPDDPNRTVYRLAPTEFYEDEYDIDEFGKFLVPVDELRIINRQSAAIAKGNSATSSDKYTTQERMMFSSTPIPTAITTVKQPPVEDAPYSDMTIRDYIAIHTGKPVSTKSWLNELVKIK